RYLVLGADMLRNAQAVERPASYTLLTLPYVVVTYILHLLAPVGLSVTYATHFVTSVGSREFVVPATIIFSAAAALLLLRGRVSREVRLGLLLIMIPLVPVLRLGQVSQQEYLVFDHYLYLSVAGWALIVSMLIKRAAQFAKLKVPAMATGLTALLL